MTAFAVRERCRRILDAGEAGDLSHFSLQVDRLDEAADYVIETIRLNYPDLGIPFHARWRHFVVAGEDRWRSVARELAVDPQEMARIRIDLAVTSVLLDAGAGARWRFRDPRSGALLARSEGLAIASLEAFTSGLFSSRPDRPLSADAAGLKAVTAASLGAAFQVDGDNPVDGLDGRVLLMNRLGDALTSGPAYFGSGEPRIGHLFDALTGAFPTGLTASRLLEVVLAAFGPIWPGRLSLGGVNLGDTWRHPGIVTRDETNGLVPFHKLSQWLTYSLIEPLADADLPVTELDGLTGLAEYRNGGLFLDTGVLAPREARTLQGTFAPGDEVIVEWRALTVALLDRIAEQVREKLGRTPEDLPLASVLEGGTWSAGRRIAAEMRPGGPPPIAIESDGSVF
ncbi:MAG: URC4/urg3 family protein [Methyloligellaceae bacterium]